MTRDAKTSKSILKPLFGVSVTLISMGLGVYTVAGPLQLYFFTLPAESVKAIGAVLTLLGISLLVLAVSLWVGRAFLLAAIPEVLDVIEKRYHSRLQEIKIDQAKLQEIYQVGYAAIGREFLELDLLQAHFDRQPLGFACWETRSDHIIRLFYVFVPLTKKATETFRLGESKTAADIKPDHISRKMNNGYSLYLNEIYGDGYPWSGIVVNKLRSHVLHLATRYANLKYLLARPVTPEGTKLVERNDFTQIPGSPVWQHEITNEDRRFQRST
jgi:hypothetical protein